MSLFEKIFGTFSEKELKKIQPIANQVLALEEKYAALPNAQLAAQTAVLKETFSVKCPDLRDSHWISLHRTDIDFMFKK